MKNGKFYFTNILNECALFNCLEVFGYVSTDHAAVGDEEKKCKQFSGVTLVVFYCLNAHVLCPRQKQHSKNALLLILDVQDASAGLVESTLGQNTPGQNPPNKIPQG